MVSSAHRPSNPISSAQRASSGMPFRSLVVMRKITLKAIAVSLLRLLVEALLG